MSDTYVQIFIDYFRRWRAEAKARFLEMLCIKTHGNNQTLTQSPDFSEVPADQIDLKTVVKMARIVSGELVHDDLIESLMQTTMRHTGAARGILILFPNGNTRIAAIASAASGTIQVNSCDLPVTFNELPQTIVNFVARAGDIVALNDALITNAYSSDPYFELVAPRSVLCIPMLKQARIVGALYLEHNFLTGLFTRDRIAVLVLVTSQVAVSLENAKLYAALEQENRDRKRAEDELRRSEALLAAAQRLTLTSSLRWKVSTGEVGWSAEGYNLMGYPIEVVPTIEMIMQRCHPDDLSYVEDQLSRSAREGSELAMKHRLLMSDGIVKYVRIMARNVSTQAGDFEFVGAVVDITEQHRTETRLEEVLLNVRQSEEHLSTIIAAIPTMAWTTSPDGQAQFFSQRWLSYTGLPTAEARGVGWTATLHPLDAPGLFKLWTEALASPHPVETEARMRRFDGEYRWLLFRAVPLLDPRGKVLNWYGTNTDIEERKRSEDALRRSKAYLEHAQKLSHTGSVGFRLSDGKVFWSEEAAHIYGYEPDVSPTMQMVLQRVHPDDVELLKEVFARAAESGRSFDFEHRLLMPDGSIKRIRNLANSVRDDSGREEVLGAVTDVTDQYARKTELEEALAKVQKSEDRLRTLIETIPAFAWSALPDGPGDYYSDAYLEYLGMKMEQASGYGWTSSIHPDDKPGILAQWAIILASKRPGEAEARVQRHDGKYRWFLFRAAPVIDAQGDVLRWYGTNFDIDDLKRAEALLAGEKTLFEMIATGHPLPTILEALCRVVEGLTDGLSTCVMLHDGQDQRIRMCIAPSLPPTFIKALKNLAETHVRLSIPVGEWSADLAQKHDLREVYSVSLLSSHRAVLGTLEVYSQPSTLLTARDQGVIERMSHLASIVVERKFADDSLRKREAFLAEGQRISHTGSFSWNARAGEVTWSEEMFKIFELDPSTRLTYRAILKRIHPDDRGIARELVRRRNSKVWEVEFRLFMRSGLVKNLYVVAQLAVNEEAVFELVGALMDITASTQTQARLRDSLNEKEALLKEVHHRVKNNLQLISSLLSLQASKIVDPTVAELFADSRNRVRSMALVHENLYHAGNFSQILMGTHVQTLCAHLGRAYGISGKRNLRLTTDVEEFELPLDRAVSAGLIINELVSNALKHAFVEGRGGQIHVKLKLLDPVRCAMSVEDDGIGIPAGLEQVDSKSLGLRLVQNLVLQLQGSLAIFNERGTRFVIEFHLRNLEKSKP